jgi:hypothetical protein
MSFSKIRHIKNVNILVENRFLKEDEQLDQIFSKINKSGFDSLDYYEKTVLDKFKKFVERGENSDRFISPERGEENISPFEILKPTGKYGSDELEGNDIYNIHDENIDKDTYVATFDDNFYINQDDVPVKFIPSKYDEVGCYKTIEEFSKNFPVWCYKTFQFFDPRLFKNIEGNIKSSDYPKWWWELQDFGQFISPYREDDIKKEKILQNSKKMFSNYIANSPSNCLKIYKKKS